MRLRTLMSSHYRTNTTNRATLHVRLMKYRPTNYYLARWLTEAGTYPFSHSLSISKSKKPVRIVLKSPFHYKKPKHRLTTGHARMSLTSTAYVPPVTRATAIKNIRDRQTFITTKTLILRSIRPDGGSLPAKTSKITVLIPLNIW